MALRVVPRLGRRILKEPLVHFLALGAVIFGVNAIVNPPAVNIGDHSITITAADAERLRMLYAQQWGAPPSASEMPRLLDEYIRQEILFREGRALGFDTDDSVVRNRIVQKMDFLLNDPSAVTMPTDAEVAAYFEQHPDKYLAPEQASFVQVYFNVSQRGGAAAEKDARATLARLAVNPADMTERGDPFILAVDAAAHSRDEIARDFGAEFTDALFAASPGTWAGPLHSAFGLHLVRVLEHTRARRPMLADVRNVVVADMISERQTALTANAYQRIKVRYKVVVEPAVLGTSGVQGAP